MRKKKTILTFLLSLSTVYTIWNTIKGVSQEFNIPIPILLVIILIIYIAWKEED